jgi:hypothetical protein
VRHIDDARTQDVRINAVPDSGYKVIVGTQRASAECPALLVMGEEAYGFSAEQWRSFVAAVNLVDASLNPGGPHHDAA